MGIIGLLIFVSLFIAVCFLIVFLWNLKSGQYDDTYSPSVRILFDDKPKSRKDEPTPDLGSGSPNSEEIFRNPTDESLPSEDKNYGKSIL